MSLIRIGAVSYLNTKPLVFGLDAYDQEASVEFDLPSRLADRLADGKLDVALIPVIETAANPCYTVVSDAAIACRGPVKSVKLVSRVQPEAIKTLALDEGSRTSAALSRVILAVRHGVEPICHPLPIDMDWRLTDSDACVIIGDRAMHRLTTPGAEHGFCYEWDLGEAWQQWTGLPFVFAVWAARPSLDFGRVGAILNHCRDLGLTNLSSIAATHANDYDLTEQDCYFYLSSHLHFFLGDSEKRGLNQFLEMAGQLNLVDSSGSLQFHDCKTA